ncbi:MAG: glycosyltransferase family 4 protein [Parcubacteria group bacterium]|nr:glycosyltransferase family 4 protein [Parcubacteria group bacterium]MCR4342505.1 glycosyltransferase family 4 protein [Patescibacteria group bacterium]
MAKNILMISRDDLIFKDGSDVRVRMSEYGTLVNRLDIIVFTKNATNSNYNNPVNIAGNVFAYATNSKSKLFYISDALKIARKLKRPDLITTQDPFEAGFSGWLIKREFNTKLQIQIHTDFLSPFFKKESILNRIRVVIANFIIPRADCVRVVSLRIKASIKKKYNISNVEVLPIFVDVKKIREAPIIENLRRKYPQFNFIILMAGRLSVEKNIPLALSVMKDIFRKYPKVGLVIVGAGPEEKKLKYKARKMKNNVIFEPWNDNLASYYKTASIFLLTSNYEGFGRTVMEATASSCPVVMTDVGLAGEIIKDGYSGFVVPVSNRAALKEALLKMINDKLLFSDLVVSAEYMAAVLFDKKEYLDVCKRLWEECAS